jgi:hypothetical protein
VINLNGLHDFPDHSAYFKGNVPKCNKPITMEKCISYFIENPKHNMRRD